MLPLVWEFHSQAEQKQDSMNDSRQQLGFGAAGLPAQGIRDKKELQGQNQHTPQPHIPSHLSEGVHCPLRAE